MEKSSLMQKLTEGVDLFDEIPPRVPVVEIAGECRVLIEQHKGIGEYSSEMIDIKVRFGSIRIGGSGLEICCMTADQLVIAGNIHTITLFGEGAR